MEIQIAKNRPDISAGLEEESEKIEPVEYETINVFDRFIEYMREVENDSHRVKKVVISNELYRLIKQSSEYQNLVQYGHGNPNVYEKPEEHKEETLYGVKIEHERFGYESIADFLIYTERKVIHSDMLEKTFLEDLDVEELLHKTNEKISERDNES